MTRKAIKPEPNTQSRGVYRGWPPTCEQCGWTGEPTQQASPYLACYGDPGRHQRTPASGASVAAG